MITVVALFVTILSLGITIKNVSKTLILYNIYLVGLPPPTHKVGEASNSEHFIILATIV